MMVMILGYVMVALLLTTVVIGISSVYLEHKRLLSLADGASTRVWAGTLPAAATILVWSASAGTGLGAVSGTSYIIEIWDEVAGSALYSVPSSGTGALRKGAPLQRITSAGGKRVSVRLRNASGGNSTVSGHMSFTVLDA